jgi:protein SCO1/2
VLRIIQIALWVLVAILGGFVVLTTSSIHLPWQPGNALPLAVSIGGPFELAATDGSTVSDQRLKGKPFAIFFGYTFCPDVCPTTLLDLTNAMKELGPDADRMRYVFVSVDPGRDSIEQLKLYLSSFDPRIIGATGTNAQIADIARKYRVIFEKVESKQGYTINHTASTYLMDAQGHFVGTFDYLDKPEVVLAKLKRLIASE